MKTLILTGLISILAAIPAQAAEECLAKSIDDVSRCTRQSLGQRFLREELAGLPSPAQAQPPVWFDTDLITLQLFGANTPSANTQLLSVRGRPGVWLLLNGEQDSDKQESLIKAALLQLTDPVGPNQRGDVKVLASGDLTTIGDECAIPPREDGPISGHYLYSAQPADWLALGEHHVLRVQLTQQEGYAGGGKSFSGEALIGVEQGALRKLACYATYNYAMLGGDWNPDGTRQHPVSEAAWRMQPVGKKGWPDLRLQPLTRHTAGLTLRWDAGRKEYLAGSK